MRGGIHDIRGHKWFKDINWLNIYNRKVEAPFKPICKNPGDTSNFDVYDEEPIRVASKDLFTKEFEEF